MRLKGQWAKVTGGDHGAYFDGRKWQPFECVVCGLSAGVIRPLDRLQLVDVAPFVFRALRGRAKNPKYLRHYANPHDAWLRENKK